MGWKRFEKEFRKAGKSVENESKRVAERVNNELIRFAERNIDRPTELVPLELTYISQPAEAVSTVQESTSIAPPVEDIKSEKISINPDCLEPGRAYIINHLTFSDPTLKERKGSEADVIRLRRIFLQFGMKVKRIHDATLDDVKAVMQKISLLDFRKLSCLVIVIMSHGHESNIIAAKDGAYSLDYDIMYPILRNRSLTSKLKLLITQSCKGPVNPLLEIEGPRVRPTAIPSEILQLNSCVEGYVSYLDPRRGSIFITTLCDHLEQSGLKDSILDISYAVVADVKKKYYDIQIPMVHTNLTKNFVFGHYVKDHRSDTEGIDDVSSDEDDKDTSKS